MALIWAGETLWFIQSQETLSCAVLKSFDGTSWMSNPCLKSRKAEENSHTKSAYAKLFWDIFEKGL